MYECRRVSEHEQNGRHLHISVIRNTSHNMLSVKQYFCLLFFNQNIHKVIIIYDFRNPLRDYRCACFVNRLLVPCVG